MKTCFNILFVFIIGISSSFSSSGGCDSLLLKGTQQINIENYQAALQIYENVIEQFPEHPVGYFCLAGVYQTIMRNYRVKTYESEFDSLINLAIHFGEQEIKHHPENAFAKLYLGKAYGYRGLHQSRNGNLISAIKDGRKGVGLIQDAAEMDTSLHSAHCWLGSYQYWRAVKTKISGLMFRNGKEKGINKISQAMAKSPFVATDGKYTLVSIYYDMKEYNKALQINHELYEQFSTNPSCLYMRSRIYEKLEDWQAARAASAQLLDHIRKSDFKSTGYEVECLYRLALYDNELGSIERSYHSLKQAYSLLKLRDASKELEGPLEKFEDIVSDMGKLHLALEEFRKVGMLKFKSYSS